MGVIKVVSERILSVRVVLEDTLSVKVVWETILNAKVERNCRTKPPLDTNNEEELLYGASRPQAKKNCSTRLPMKHE